MTPEVPFYLLFGMGMNVVFTILHMRLEHHRSFFTIIYYELDKHDKKKLSMILIPGAYFILRTILYDETQMEHETGTLSIFLAALLVLLFMKQVVERCKGRIPG